MLESTLPLMEQTLADVKALFRALEVGSMAGEAHGTIQSALAYIDVVPGYPLVFATDALDRHVDFYYTTADMDEDGMGERFEFQMLVGDRTLKNKVFDAVDIHGDWLRVQTGIYKITKQIDARLRAP